MFKWKKLGLLFDAQKYANGSWLQEFAQAPATLFFDEYIRIYFSCRPKPDGDGNYVSQSAFVDVDSQNPMKILRVAENPILDRGKVGTFDEFGIYPVTPIRIKNEVYLYYGGWTRCESVPFNVAIGIAKSNDQGVSFERIGDGPILSYTPHEPYVISGPKIRYFNNQFYLFYIAGRKWKSVSGRQEPIYKIRMATSSDGFNWKRENRDLIDSKVEADEAQASPDVFYMDGKYHMFFCYRYSENYRSKEYGYRIGYASSLDLVNWNRDDTCSDLTVSESGWDSEMVSYPHVFESNGSVYMAYLGNQVGRHGFGLAKLI